VQDRAHGDALAPGARPCPLSLFGCQPSTAIAAELDATTLRSRKSVLRALRDHASFKLGNGCHLLEHELAGGTLDHGQSALPGRQQKFDVSGGRL